ncbi:hypothetical protein C357_10612 [Citreicella sp. 357]|nr:hypothetical protein C357_10612 [Citreicella sp. 357]
MEKPSVNRLPVAMQGAGEGTRMTLSFAPFMR